MLLAERQKMVAKASSFHRFLCNYLALLIWSRCNIQLLCFLVFAPDSVHLLLLIIQYFNVLHPRSTSKYFGRRVGTSHDDSLQHLPLFEWEQQGHGYFFKLDPVGLYLLQHMFYIICSDTFSVKLSNKSSFWCSLMEMWAMDISEARSQRLNVPQSPVSWKVKGTCTHLKKKGGLFSLSLTI